MTSAHTGIGDSKEIHSTNVETESFFNRARAMGQRAVRRVVDSSPGMKFAGIATPALSAIAWGGTIKANEYFERSDNPWIAAAAVATIGIGLIRLKLHYDHNKEQKNVGQDIKKENEKPVESATDNKKEGDKAPLPVVEESKKTDEAPPMGASKPLEEKATLLPESKIEAKSKEEVDKDISSIEGEKLESEAKKKEKKFIGGFFDKLRRKKNNSEEEAETSKSRTKKSPEKSDKNKVPRAPEEKPPEEQITHEELVRKIGAVAYYSAFSKKQHNAIARDMLKLVEKFAGDKAKNYETAHESTQQILEDLLNPDKDGFVRVTDGMQKLKIRFVQPPEDENEIKELLGVEESMRNGDKLQQLSTGLYRPEDIFDYARHGAIVSNNSEKEDYIEKIRQEVSDRVERKYTTSDNFNYQFKNLDGKTHHIFPTENLRNDETEAKTIPDHKILARDYGYGESLDIDDGGGVGQGWWVSSSDLYARMGIIDEFGDSKHEDSASNGPEKSEEKPDSKPPKKEYVVEVVEESENELEFTDEEFNLYKKFLAYQDLDAYRKSDEELREELKSADKNIKLYLETLDYLLKERSYELESALKDVRNYFYKLESRLPVSEFTESKSDSWISWGIIEQELLKDKPYFSISDPDIDYSGSIFAEEDRERVMKIIAWRQLGYEIKGGMGLSSEYIDIGRKEAGLAGLL